MNMFISFPLNNIPIFSLARSLYFILTTYYCLDIPYSKNAKTQLILQPSTFSIISTVPLGSNPRSATDEHAYSTMAYMLNGRFQNNIVH